MGPNNPSSNLYSAMTHLLKIFGLIIHMCT